MVGMNMLLMKKKKNDLGNVWMAAHFPKRINKQLVHQTNITSSVDKILVDQLPIVTYRILGFLLLGVARIYSKKVEFLLIDCNHSLNEMKHFSEGRRKVDINFGGMCVPESSSHRSKANEAVDMSIAESSGKKKCNNFVEAMRTQFSSISLPENFELDAFDLEIVENDSSNDHVRPHLELVLNDARENDRTRHHAFGKERFDLPARFSDHASTSTSAMNTNISLETSAEKFRDRFSLDECMDPMVLSESDEEDVDHAVVPFIEQGPESDNINSSDMIFEDRENPETNDNHPDEECITGQTVVSEIASTDNKIMVKPSPEKSQLSVTINVTPQSKAPVVSGKHKSDFVAVRTPASKEHVRAPRKRKCVYDDHIVIPNKEYKQWLLNASDLVRKRKRGPTAIIASKEQQSFDGFTQPIIPFNAGFPLDIRSVISKNDIVLIEEEQQVEQSMERDSKVDDLVPLDMHEIIKERDEGIAPSTPVSQATSVRFNEIHDTSKGNQAKPTSPYESGEKEHSAIRDFELYENQMEEEASSLGEVNQENEKWSAVTKRVGGYLHSNFVRREEEAVELTEILKQKNKKESGRFFYQILVLKTGGYIDVKQEKPYGEISVMQTPKLKEVFEGGHGKG